jgi:hypothetical protein
MTCCGSKKDFCKKSGACLFTAKVQTRPGSNEICRSLRKIQNIPPKVSAIKQELICVSQAVYYFTWGVMSSFWFRVSVVASQKNSILALRKWKRHFSWDETKLAFVAFLTIPGATSVSYMALFRETTAWSGPTLAIWPKSHTTSNVVGHFCEGTFW